LVIVAAKIDREKGKTIHFGLEGPLAGGTIALTTGLLRCLDIEPSMAFVVAHELGHLHGRDHLRGLGRQLGFQVVSALVFSGNTELRMGAGQIGQLTLLSHSRHRETVADCCALRLVQNAFGTGSGATRLFEILGEDGQPAWA
jgi:Zn-dependent protease with chaperone function